MTSKTIVIGVTGGIAVYKALEVVSLLIKKNYDVHVIMTRSAQEFVRPLSFQSLTGNLVTTDMFEEPKSFDIKHISLAKKADAILVVPATANVIGKVSNGISDDMLSTTIMAATCPVFFAPAMNTNMYKNPIVQRNIDNLKSYGYKFINPTSGRLACGDIGEGKLANIEEIVNTVHSYLYDIKDMKDKRVLVTAGPTISNIDPVRYITNRSSGKMGVAVAQEARDRGANVSLICAKSTLDHINNADLQGIDIVPIETNEEMYTEVMKRYDKSNIVIKAAAVADYKTSMYSKEKIKKISDSMSLSLTKDRDILKELGETKSTQILVGFAAESENLLSNAYKKLNKKNLDYIVANDITSKETGFASDFNKVVIIKKDGSEIELEKMKKREIARELFNTINKNN